MVAVIAALEYALRDCGYAFQAGAGVTAVQAAFSAAV